MNGERVVPALFYRKRPGEVEALQFDGSLQSANGIQFSFDHPRTPASTRARVLVDPATEDVMLMLRSDHGWVTAVAGDWVIRGASGELYPCSADKFAEIYEAVPE